MTLPTSPLGPILVVEDDPPNLRLLRFILERAGFVVHAVRDAEAALTAMRETTPRLVVTDLNLPGMSGVALTRRLKANAATRDIPVVAVTSLDVDDELTRQAREAGAIVSLHKPFRSEQFTQLIQVLAADLPAERRT